MQRADFEGLLKVMGSFPVVIRLLDPPLHEFLPKREDLLVQIAKIEATKPKSPKLKELHKILERVEELNELNPMLALRGCRLGITYPEITEMQAQAIFEAAASVKKKGSDPHVEIMIPLRSVRNSKRKRRSFMLAHDVFRRKASRSSTKLAR